MNLITNHNIIYLTCKVKKLLYLLNAIILTILSISFIFDFYHRDLVFHRNTGSVVKYWLYCYIPRIFLTFARLLDGGFLVYLLNLLQVYWNCC